jgi:non-homologous end joining protein Ku
VHLGFVHLGCLGNEVRAAEPYFDRLTPKPDPEAVALASELIKRMSGRFEPEKMPDEYSRAVRELVKAKVEHRAPEVMIEADGKPKAPAGGHPRSIAEGVPRDSSGQRSGGRELKLIAKLLLR